MIAWESMDERERAVWSAALGAHFQFGHTLEQAVEVADRAVEKLREYLGDWPYGEKP